MTQSGYTGFMLSSYRPLSPLYVFTKTHTLVNQLSLSWGVQAFYYDGEESMDAIVADQVAFLKEKGFTKNGRRSGEYRQHACKRAPADQHVEGDKCCVVW